MKIGKEVQEFYYDKLVCETDRIKDKLIKKRAKEVLKSMSDKDILDMLKDHFYGEVRCELYDCYSVLLTLKRKDTI
jgi:hypothetical protein